jgi:hypothetical protein
MIPVPREWPSTSTCWAPVSARTWAISASRLAKITLLSLRVESYSYTNIRCCGKPLVAKRM